MATQKNKYDKAYDDGYKVAKDGNSLGDASKGMLDLLWFLSDETTESYDEGYKDGKEDRYDGGNSNYHGHNSTCEDSSGCFITTATLLSVGKPDNCDELNTFRNFRDTWLTQQKEGGALISEYYAIAPEIVKAIDERPDSTAIYSHLWESNIKPCLALIQNGDFEAAQSMYCTTVINLKTVYLDK